MKLLIIEDEPITMEILKCTVPQILQGELKEMRFADSLAEAEIQMQRFLPNVVLFDIHLPDGNAFALVKRWQDFLRLFLCMSSSTKEVHFDDVVENGIVAYIEKPITKENLENAFLKVLPHIRKERVMDNLVLNLIKAQRESDGEIRQTNKELEEAKKKLEGAKNDISEIAQQWYQSSTLTQDTTHTQLHLRIRQDGLIRTIVISPHDILVIESHDNKVFIALNDGETVHEATITMKSLEALLPPSLFVRCHASYFVHLGSIIAFSAKDLTLTTGEIVPISRARQEQTHAAIASYRLPKRPEYQVAHLA